MPKTALHRALAALEDSFDDVARNTEPIGGVARDIKEALAGLKFLENRVDEIEQVNRRQAREIEELECRTTKLEEWQEKIARDLGQDLVELLKGLVERVERVERHCGLRPSSK